MLELPNWFADKVDFKMLLLFTAEALKDGAVYVVEPWSYFQWILVEPQRWRQAVKYHCLFEEDFKVNDSWWGINPMIYGSLQIKVQA